MSDQVKDHDWTRVVIKAWIPFSLKLPEKMDTQELYEMLEQGDIWPTENKKRGMTEPITITITKGHDTGLNPSAVRECVEALELVVSDWHTFYTFQPGSLAEKTYLKAKQALERIKDKT